MSFMFKTLFIILIRDWLCPLYLFINKFYLCFFFTTVDYLRVQIENKSKTTPRYKSCNTYPIFIKLIPTEIYQRRNKFNIKILNPLKKKLYVLDRRRFINNKSIRRPTSTKYVRVTGKHL